MQWGRNLVSLYRQGIRLHSVKLTQNGQMGMKIKAERLGETGYTGARLDRVLLYIFIKS